LHYAAVCSSHTIMNSLVMEHHRACTLGAYYESAPLHRALRQGCESGRRPFSRAVRIQQPKDKQGRNPLHEVASRYTGGVELAWVIGFSSREVRMWQPKTSISGLHCIRRRHGTQDMWNLHEFPSMAVRIRVP
jgi:hypothetical protein